MQAIFPSSQKRRQAQLNVYGAIPWWNTTLFGYIASVLLVFAVVLVKYINQLLASTPYFALAPLGIVTVVVAFTWGPGPALFSIVMGLLATQMFLVPNVFTMNLWHDIAISGPFVFIELIVVLLIVQLSLADRKLSQTNRKLEHANVLKDYFIKRASHELRTPLTSIRGHAQLALRRLQKVPVPLTEGAQILIDKVAQLQHSLKKIEIQTRHMQALIENLFDLSSLHSGKLPLRLTECNLGDMCQEIIEEQSAFSGRQIVLTLSSEPVVLLADSERLYQVVTNLLVNAVKYSPEPTIIYVQVDQQPAEILMQVQNEGPALLSEEQKRLFDPFYRTPEAENLEPGWGLGLSISKEIVESHDGKIWVESTPDKKTIFFVQFPRRQQPGT